MEQAGRRRLQERAPFMSAKGLFIGHCMAGGLFTGRFCSGLHRFSPSKGRELYVRSASVFCGPRNIGATVTFGSHECTKIAWH